MRKRELFLLAQCTCRTLAHESEDVVERLESRLGNIEVVAPVSFRVDRIANCRTLERTFEQKRGQRLSDYLRKVQKDVDAWRKENPTAISM